MSESPTERLNLKQVAAALDVHYMTAYRYVRTRQLRAEQIGTNWFIDPAEFAAFQKRRVLRSVTTEGPGMSWRQKIFPLLLSGDEAEAWRLLEQALLSGTDPIDCYLDVLVGALHDISAGSATESPHVGEYIAVATASRLVARLGARLRRPGRTRGTVIFGAPAGEHHAFPIAVIADVVRLSGFDCLELGANVPADVFANATIGVRRLVAVGIGLTMATHAASLRETICAIRSRDAAIPIVLGGQATQAIVNGDISEHVFWAPQGPGVANFFDELAKQRRPYWAQQHSAI